MECMLSDSSGPVGGTLLQYAFPLFVLAYAAIVWVTLLFVAYTLSFYRRGSSRSRDRYCPHCINLIICKAYPNVNYAERVRKIMEEFPESREKQLLAWDQVRAEATRFLFVPDPSDDSGKLVAIDPDTDSGTQTRRSGGTVSCLFSCCFSIGCNSTRSADASQVSDMPTVRVETPKGLQD